MTPYQTPHSQQTPRYGHQTPSQAAPSPTPHMNGPFLHPGAITPSHRTPTYRNLTTPSPLVPSPSPHPSPAARSYTSDSKSYSPRTNYGPYKSYSGEGRRSGSSSHSESMDWQKAAEAWARSKNRDSSSKFYFFRLFTFGKLILKNRFLHYQILPEVK